MKENLIKCTVRTSGGLIVECEISQETFEKLKKYKFCIYSQD